MKTFYLLSLSIILLASAPSCKKKDNLPDTIVDTTAYLGIYQPAGMTGLDNAVMYTNSGSITDTALIQSFLSRRSYLPNFDLDHDSIASNVNLQVYFERGGNILFLSGGSADTIRTAKVSESATELILGRRDTAIFQLTSFTESTCDSLYRLALKAKPWRSMFFNYPPPTGTEPGIRMETRYRIEIDNGAYTLPLMTIATTSEGAGCQRLFSGVWNTVDAGALGELAVGDTAVVQVGRVRLGKL